MLIAEKVFRIWILTGLIAVVFSSESHAQKASIGPARPVYRAPIVGQSNGAKIGSAVEQGYYFSQQGQQIRQWQGDQRQSWQLDQQRKQQWLQDQQRANAVQQQQQRSFIAPTAHSTPMYIAPAPRAVQQQRAQQWEQQYQGRQQTLQQWRMQPLSR